MPLFRNKTEFFERGAQRIIPDDNRANEDCKICLAPLDLLEQPDGADRDIRLHAAVRIKCCSHIFGAECLDAWLDCGNTCPVCNRMLFLPVKEPVTTYEISDITRDLRDMVDPDTLAGVIATYIYKLEDQATKRKRQNAIQINIERAKLEEEARRDHAASQLTAEDFEDSDVEDFDDWNNDADQDDDDDDDDDDEFYGSEDSEDVNGADDEDDESYVVSPNEW